MRENYQSRNIWNSKSWNFPAREKNPVYSICKAYIYVYLFSSAEGTRAAVVGLHAASGEAASNIVKRC